MILGLPMDVAYPFILDVQGYPSQIIYLLIVVVRCFHFLSLSRYDNTCVGSLLDALEQTGYP